LNQTVALSSHDAQASERLQRAELQAAVVGVNEAIQRLTTFNEGLVNSLLWMKTDHSQEGIEGKVDRLWNEKNGEGPQP